MLTQLELNTITQYLEGAVVTSNLKSIIGEYGEFYNNVYRGTILEKDLIVPNKIINISRGRILSTSKDFSVAESFFFIKRR